MFGSQKVLRKENIGENKEDKLKERKTLEKCLEYLRKSMIFKGFRMHFVDRLKAYTFRIVNG